MIDLYDLDAAMKTVSKQKKEERDEWYTPREAVLDIVDMIDAKTKNVWLPFDDEESEIYKVLTSSGRTVKCTHIKNGDDFFNLTPPFKCDAIISNPPYSKKVEIIKRLNSFNLPYALLLNVQSLEQIMKHHALDEYCESGYDIVLPSSRYKFSSGFLGEKKSSPPFYSCWFTHRLISDSENSIGSIFAARRN